MITLQVRVGSSYGNDWIYPVNDAAKSLAKIARQRTLSLEALELARGMGMAVTLDDSPEEDSPTARRVLQLERGTV